MGVNFYDVDLELIKDRVADSVYSAVKTAYEEGVYTEPLKDMTREELKKAHRIGGKSVDQIQLITGSKSYTPKEVKLALNNRALKKTVQGLETTVKELERAQPILQLQKIYDEVKTIAVFRTEVVSHIGKVDVSFDKYGNCSLRIKITDTKDSTVHRVDFTKVRSFCEAILEGMRKADEIDVLLNKVKSYTQMINGITKISAEFDEDEG